jgi:ubiquinone/menaquinone biosynthesis C-methylase UbiE
MSDSAHDRAILNYFTQQARSFAAGPELHGREVIQLIVNAAAPKSEDRAIDLACGPGSIVCTLAETVAHATGLDATPAMLDEARALATRSGRSNVTWLEGDVYRVPYPDGAFTIVTCRFAFHHFVDPIAAFAEMVRLAAPGGRIVLCDGMASADPAKAETFNAMERWRDPSTVEFRTEAYLQRLFVNAGLGEPERRYFQVPYLANDLVAASFPKGGDRDSLAAMFEGSVEGDPLGMGAHRTPDGVKVAFPSVVLSAIKPGGH